MTGLGLVSLTKKKLDEMVKETAQKYGISQKEAEKMANDLLTKAEDRRDDLEQEYEKVFSNALKKMNIPTRKEFDELKKRLKKWPKKRKSPLQASPPPASEAPTSNKKPRLLPKAKRRKKCGI